MYFSVNQLDRTIGIGIVFNISSENDLRICQAESRELKMSHSQP